MTSPLGWTAPCCARQEDLAFGFEYDDTPEDDPPAELRRFRFTFHPVGRPGHRQAVTVSAPNPRGAWNTFEALYPFRRFIAPRMECL